MIDRRYFLAAAAMFAGGCARAAPDERQRADSKESEAATRFEAIRAALGPGGRLGVAALETGSDRKLSHDADSRYAMASTFKFPLAAAVLALADRGALRLSEKLPFGPGDPLDHSPVVEAHMRLGRLPVEQLCAAAVMQSDNSAANILLRRIGGPQTVTRFVRACGDRVTRMDRFELELNSNIPGDPRDTTSPAAMAALVRKLVLGDVLRSPSRARLADWLKTAVPGKDRLTAGLPRDWQIGHKTGTGRGGSYNDVAIAWPSRRPPIVIACYLSGGDASPNVRAAAHASVARLVAETFA